MNGAALLANKTWPLIAASFPSKTEKLPQEKLPRNQTNKLPRNQTRSIFLEIRLSCVGRVLTNIFGSQIGLILHVVHGNE